MRVTIFALVSSEEAFESIVGIGDNATDAWLVIKSEWEKHLTSSGAIKEIELHIETMETFSSRDYKDSDLVDLAALSPPEL